MQLKSTNKRSKIIAFIIAVILVISQLNIMKINAIEVSDGTFNPEQHNLEITFRLQYTQPLDISVYDESKFYGKIVEKEEFSGYDGNLKPRRPEDVRLIENEINLHSEDLENNTEIYEEKERIEEEFISEENIPGESTTEESTTEESTTEERTTEERTTEEIKELEKQLKKEVVLEDLSIKIVDKEDSVLYGIDDSVIHEEIEPGNHKITWDGRVEGYPFLGDDREDDAFIVNLKVQPLGYPDRNTNCSNTPNGHIHGEVWDWTTKYSMDTTFLIDYNYGFVFLKGGPFDKHNKEFTEIFKSQGMEVLAQMFPDLVIPLDCGDPVNIIDGNFYFEYTDLRIESEIPLTFSRNYSSINENGSLGKGFSHSYDYSLVENKGLVTITAPFGEKILFIKEKAGNYHELRGSEFSLVGNNSGYTLTHKYGAEFIFNQGGLLEEIKRPDKKTVATLTYNGKELSRIDAIAGSLRFTSNNGLITSVTDDAGRTVRYEYQNGNLVKVTNVDGDSLEYSYDKNGYLAEASDFNGDVYIRNEYDETGRVLKQTFINANVETKMSFSYDDVNRVNTFINQYGKTYKYYYDKNRKILGVEESDGTTSNSHNTFATNSLTDSEGNKTEYEFDSQDNISKAIYANGNSVSNTYTNDGFLESISYLDGGSEKYEYSAENYITKYTDKNGNESKYEYDNLGLITKKIDALGNEITYTYDNRARMTSETDQLGNIIQYKYDNVGRITEIIDETGQSTFYEYSNGGKLLSLTDTLGNKMSYNYNGNGFATDFSDDKGNTSKTEYGTNGQILKTTDARGNETIYTYDTKGNVKRIENPDGSFVEYEYNEKGETIKTKDADGGTTTSEYDSLGRLIKETDALGNFTQNFYNAIGQLEKTIDKNGNETVYTYDILGRPEKMTDATGGEITYKYDLAGNVIEIIDQNGNSKKMTYDKLNRQETVTDHMGYTTRYEYDQLGRVLSITNGAGNKSIYTYDVLGNVLTE